VVFIAHLLESQRKIAAKDLLIDFLNEFSRMTSSLFKFPAIFVFRRNETNHLQNISPFPAPSLT